MRADASERAYLSRVVQSLAINTETVRSFSNVAALEKQTAIESNEWMGSL